MFGGITRDWFAGARSLAQKLFVGEALSPVPVNCDCRASPCACRFGVVSLLLLAAPFGLACDRDEKIERQDRTDSD